jgi:hypothetical protein
MSRLLLHGPAATWALLIFTAWMIIMWTTTGSLVPMILWFIGLAAVIVLWLASRPRQNVHIFGPNGQEWIVTAVTAERRVRSGWSYQPQAPRS